MPSASAIILTAVVLLIASVGVYVYFFGIPPEMKKELEEKALKTMGENKASYVLKDQLSKIPASDQEDVKQLKKGLGNVLGGALKNPIGDKAGDTADDATRPLTGR